jgi:hypothetical protein
MTVTTAMTGTGNSRKKDFSRSQYKFIHVLAGAEITC